MLFSYTIRNLFERRTTMLPTVLAIAAAVGATVVMLALLEGLTSAVLDAGNPDNAVVLSKGASSEAESRIPTALLPQIKVAPGVAQREGAVSAELHAALDFKRPSGILDSIVVRGVDPAAFQVHGGARAEGQALQRGQQGVLIGVRQIDKFEGFHVGGTVLIGRHRWPVVGVLRAPGTKYESELWVDRSALGDELKMKDPSVVYVTLERQDAIGAFTAAIARIPGDAQLEALSERAFYQRTLAPVAIYVHAIMFVVLMLGLGALLASTNAMYAAFLGRIRELATLLAIGYTRRRVAVLLLIESMIIASVGGLIGLAIAATTNGRVISYDAMALIYSARVSVRVVIAGVIGAAVIGLFGNLVSLFQLMRLNVLSALRET
jgi:putative ABC transport system permease protein